MKKLLSILVILCMLTASTITVSAEQPTLSKIEEATKIYTTNHSNSIKTYFAVKDEFLTNDDTYGGCYIDDNGNLNVWYTEGIKEYKNLLAEDVKQSQSIIYRKASFTYDELEAANDLLFDSMEELGIEVLSIDEFNNRIQVVMSSKDYNEQAVINCVGNPNMLIFDYITSAPTDDATYTIRNGSQLTDSSGYYSMAVGAVRNGKYGFITAAHCGSVGGSVLYNGLHMGTFRARVYGPKVDVAFIERSSITHTYKATNLFTDGTGYTRGTDYVSGGFPSGTSVTKYGATTGKTTGKIKSTSVSYTVNDTKFKKLVSATYSSDGGDSGGAIKVTVSSDGTYCAGIHKGRYTTNFGNNYAVFTDMTLAKEALGFSGYYD